MNEEPALVLRELTPELWPELVALFGSNGACGGCWCMYWRIGPKERFEDVKGERARARLEALVRAGQVHGVLAFADEVPVGWCAFERRVELAKLDRAPSLRVDDAERVWSLPCFFIKSGWRGKGVASALLAAAERALRARGCEIAEGYPVKLAGRIPAAFAWTGVASMFEAAGFELAEARPKGKQRYRKTLAGGAPAKPAGAPKQRSKPAPKRAR
ncbi:MAG: GNAT family N-acetyltransferase [Polyangiaceae bacterium]|nr:GNAT family N-acetyltransferase [Polyangiaceae bacterium]